MGLIRYEPQDIEDFSARFEGMTDEQAWKWFAVEWRKHEEAGIGEPTTPHEFVLRFLNDWTRCEIGQGAFASGPEMIYVALREAFFQAMTHEVQIYNGAGARAIK